MRRFAAHLAVLAAPALAIVPGGVGPVRAQGRAAAPGVEGAADARRAALAAAEAHRRRLAAAPAAYGQVRPFRCLGPGCSGLWAGLFERDGGRYVLTVAPGTGPGLPVAVEAPPASQGARAVRAALGRLVWSGDGLLVQRLGAGAERAAALRYPGPVLLRVGDRVVILTSDGPRAGRISPLSAPPGDEAFLPGEPTSHALIIDPEQRLGAAPRGAPVVLAETGTLVGAVTGMVAGGTGLVQFERLRFGAGGRKPQAGPVRLAFGVPIPAKGLKTAQAARRALFPADVCRFAPGGEAAELLSTRPFLRRRGSTGTECLGREYFFDSATYVSSGGRLGEIRLETAGWRHRRPGRAEAALAAVDFCQAVYGTPKALKYLNRRRVLPRGVEYNVVLLWQPMSQAVYLLLTVSGPELTGTLLVAPAGTPLTHVLAGRDVKDVAIRPLDVYVVREFVRQWLIRTLGADASHPLHGAAEALRRSATRPAGPSPPSKPPPAP